MSESRRQIDGLSLQTGDRSLPEEEREIVSSIEGPITEFELVEMIEIEHGAARRSGGIVLNAGNWNSQILEVSIAGKAEKVIDALEITHGGT
jgi:hypothetical protein